MRTRAHLPSQLPAAITSLGLLACQGGDLTLPANTSPASLNVVSGNGQLGAVGTPLPDPLVVRVTDAANQPVGNVNLRFETQVPGAEINPPATTTTGTGLAAVQVQLGTTEGLQTVEVFLAEAGDIKTTFALIAVAAQPPVGGDGDDDDDGGSADDGDGGNGNGEGRGGGRGRGRGGGNGHGGDDDD